MSSLTDIEKRYIEKLLCMESGSVLGYSDRTYGQFFHGYGVDIHNQKYQINGTSKANKMRTFWKSEPDALVGRVLAGMIASYEADCNLGVRTMDSSILAKSKNIVSRLRGEPQPVSLVQGADDFLNLAFNIPSADKLPINAQVRPIIQSRVNEAQKALKAGCYLSVIFLCGSVLEATLFGAAQNQPALFNRASAGPKANDGSVKSLREWSLAQLIDAACEVGLLKPDIKKFSHGLRDFRNYIHPNEQIKSGFTPDEHTARICLQVLKAALANVAGER